jgi:hypothetical protein
MRNAHTKYLSQKHVEKRPHGGARGKWEDTIKMDLKEVAYEITNCIHMARDRDQWRSLVNTITGSIKRAEFLDQLSDY